MDTYADELLPVADEPATELNNDECTRIWQIKVGGDIRYWIGAEDARKAVIHIPDYEYDPESTLEVRAITLQEANELSVDNMDGVIRRMSAYFNENPKCGDMIVCVEY